MNQYIRVAVLVAAGATAFCGCGDDPSEVDRPPVARLTLDIRTEETWAGTPAVNFVADPLASRDDETPFAELEARWDYEADGEWDTDFGPLDYDDCFIPDPLPDGIWRARVQVRDGGGNAAVATAELALPDWLPDGPDIKAVGTDHTSACWPDGGEYCYKVNIWDCAWLVPPTLDVVYEFQVDNVPVGTVVGRPGSMVELLCTSDGGPWGNLRPYNVMDVASFLSPGTHQVAIVADATNLVDEVDETNNRVVRIIIVDQNGRVVGVPRDPVPR